MALRVQRRQFVGYTVFTYTAAAWSVLDCLQPSLSFLDACLKLCEGLNLVVLCNFAIVNSILLWKGLTRLLFGELRLLEYEHIFERLSFTIVNCFFMSSAFPEYQFLTVMILFALLTFIRVFHWVLKDRLEYVFQHTDERTNIARLLCSRFFLNVIIFAVVDYQMVRFCLRNSLTNKHDPSPSAPVYILFCVDFSMLLVDVAEVAMKSVINLIELIQCKRAFERDGDDFVGLDGKFMYEKLVQLVCQVLKLGLRVASLAPFSMPLMIAKDIIWDGIALFHTGKSVWRTWKSNRQIDEKLPDVTEAQLNASEDKMCIVCMEDMLPPSEATSAKHKPKKLPCNHCLHLGCLKSWMERSQTCPICRVSVFDSKGNVALPNQSAAQQPNSEDASVAQQPLSAANESNSTSLESTHTGSLGAVSSSNPNFPTWYTFPVTLSDNDGAVDFKVRDINGVEINAKLIIKKRPGFDVPKEQDQESQRVVINDPPATQYQDIERLKRRISELENKVEELTKKARTE